MVGFAVQKGDDRLSIDDLAAARVPGWTQPFRSLLLCVFLCLLHFINLLQYLTAFVFASVDPMELIR